MDTKLTFTLRPLSADQAALDIKYDYQQSANKVIYQGVAIKQSTVSDGITIYLQNPLTLTFKNLQMRLSQILRVSYPDGSSETIDNVIRGLISGDTKAGTSTLTKERVIANKAYAHYYYNLFKGRVLIGMEKNEPPFSDVKMLIDLASHYFSKRLVHVFVMSAIYERVFDDSVGAPQVQQFTGTSVTQLAAERERFEQQKRELLAAVNNTQLTSEQKLQQVTNELMMITQEMQKKDENIAKLQNDNKNLSARVTNYRELLVSSHDLLFKIDEIPTIMKN